MIKTNFLIIFLLAVNTLMFSQQKQEYITVIGDSLVGKTINGESIREVHGNVVLTQGNIRITCKEAIQNISKNDAELLGNVIARQDSITITTNHGFYFGNERRAEGVEGVTLNDKKVILKADSGNYFFNEHKAVFRHNVILYDSSTTLHSDSLTYFKDTGKAVAVGNVKILDAENEIDADSLIHFRNTKISFANKNVKIINLHNGVTIWSNHLENYPERKYTFISQSPLLMQIDTSYTKLDDTTGIVVGKPDSVVSQIDTLLISSQKMKAFRDTANIFMAIDSVQIIRGNFASKNNLTTYYRDSGRIITKKMSRASAKPIIWYSNSQLTGDSVVILLAQNRISKLEVNGDAFLLSQNHLYKSRFDQISGNKVVMKFSEGDIKQTEVYGGIHSIYYMYEDSTRNGLVKSSSQSIIIKFLNRKVNAVKLYGSPTSEYYPENKVKGKERSFTLPEYIFYKNRPRKQNMLKVISMKK